MGKKKLKLIEGVFKKFESLKLINELVDAKINFHKVRRLSKIEGDFNDKCIYDNSRINELTMDKKTLKDFIMTLEKDKKNIKISSTVTIEIIDNEE